MSKWMVTSYTLLFTIGNPVFVDMGLRSLILKEFLYKLEHGSYIVVGVPKIGILLNWFFEMIDLVTHLLYLLSNFLIFLLILDHESV